jgi:hypothetical protein
MLTELSKVNLFIHDHALLMHLLDGIRWLLEAFNKVKNELQLYSNKEGVCTTKEQKTTLNMQNTARRAKRSITTAR